MSHHVVERLRLNDEPAPPLPGGGPLMVAPGWLCRLSDIGLGLTSLGAMVAIVASWFESGSRDHWALVAVLASNVGLAGVVLLVVSLTLYIGFALRRRRVERPRGFEVVVGRGVSATADPRERTAG